MDKDQIIIMNLCGRGDKDIGTVAQHHGCNALSMHSFMAGTR
jgi:tryptophan synthase beta subunit